MGEIGPAREGERGKGGGREGWGDTESVGSLVVRKKENQ